MARTCTQVSMLGGPCNSSRSNPLLACHIRSLQSTVNILHNMLSGSCNPNRPLACGQSTSLLRPPKHYKVLPKYGKICLGAPRALAHSLLASTPTS